MTIQGGLIKIFPKKYSDFKKSFFFFFQKPPSVFDLLKSQMAEVAKNKKRGIVGGGGMVTDNFMRQFRDSDSLELKKLSAAQFMEVWEHYDSDGKNFL